MSVDERDEEKLLHAVALQNANSVMLARQRAEQELVRTKEELEARTEELARSLALMETALRELDAAHVEALEARRVAQEANAAKSRFLSVISHELRTPLGAIGGYAEIIAEGIHGPINDVQRHDIARIKHNQQHLLSLVNELLDFARIESGRFPLYLTTVSLLDVLESARSMIEPQIAHKGHQLDVRIEPADLAVCADRERVEQIVLNLLSNAVKFTARGGNIVVTASASKDGVALHVHDTGIGIPENLLASTFESFVQLAPSLAHTGGAGLGLAISRQLARAMQGDLTASSEFGRGSTFTLRLPHAHEDCLPIVSSLPPDGTIIGPSATSPQHDP